MSSPAGYSGTPLAAKLGIRPGSRVLLDGVREVAALDEMPAGVTVHRRAGHERYDVVLLFAPSAARLRARWPVLLPRLEAAGRLWVCWAKKSSGTASDLTEREVRDFGLTEGLVDVKVCAVDATWSALAFVRRLRDR